MNDRILHQDPVVHYFFTHIKRATNQGALAFYPFTMFFMLHRELLPRKKSLSRWGNVEHFHIQQDARTHLHFTHTFTYFHTQYATNKQYTIKF